MPRETIGEIDCPQCRRVAEVRKNSKSKLYYYCPTCGMMQPNLPGGQDFILENARMYPNGEKPDAEAPPDGAQVEAPPAPEPEPGMTPAPAPDDPEPAPPKKKGFFDDLDEPF